MDQLPALEPARTLRRALHPHRRARPRGSALSFRSPAAARLSRAALRRLRKEVPWARDAGDVWLSGSDAVLQQRAGGLGESGTPGPCRHKAGWLLPVEVGGSCRTPRLVTV